MRKPADLISFYDSDLEERRPRILTAASDLFSEFGFADTTMMMMADKSELSLGKLKAEYSNKQQILNELMGFHIDVLEGIRAFTRNDPELSPLQSMLQEWELICEYLNNHQGTIQAFQQNQSNIAPGIRNRIERLRNQDIELLEKACALKELPVVNTASLEGVLYGTLWSLILEFTPRQEPASFTVIPGMVFSKVLAPLMQSSGRQAS
jgi:AcrR family transcriptional regulator